MKLNTISFFSILLYVAVVSADDEDIVSFIGEDVVLSCEGNIVRWQLNDGREVFDSSLKYQKVAGENESQLVIKNFTSTDEGRYRCHSREKIDKYFSLKEFQSQVITQNTNYDVINENGRVLFQCRTEGIPKSTVKWWFGEKELVNGNNIKMNKDSITLERVQPSQAGEYSCTVEQELNNYRDRQERYFDLVVLTGNSRYTFKYPVEVNAVEHEEISLECFKNETIKSDVKWYFNGKEMADENKIKITSNQIKFESVQRTQAGKYMCESEDRKRELKLIVKYAPNFRQSGPIKISKKINETAVLECTADGVPFPKFQWLKEGRKIYENVENSNFVSRLTVDTQEEDDGDFTCLAGNEIGERPLSFILQKGNLNDWEDSNGSNLQILSIFAFLLSAFVLSL